MRIFCSLYKKCRRENVVTTTLDCFIEYTDEPTSEPKTAKNLLQHDILRGYLLSLLPIKTTYSPKK